MPNLEALASFEDFRAAAKRALPRILFDYIDGGSYSETTLKRNVNAFQDLTLDQRVMLDMSNISSEIELFGEKLAAPIILAPVGFSGMYAKRGEVQAAKAAYSHNLPFCLSTVGICSIDEVTQDAGKAPWFQLYMIKDRACIADLLAKAQDNGSKVLVLTADLQTPGARYRDVRSGMMRKLSVVEYMKRGLEGVMKAHWSYNVMLKGRPHTFGNLQGVLPENASFDEAWKWISQNFDPSVNWDDLAFIREHWKGPIVLKGIMTAEDAKLAVEHELDGIVVSNHGGRQLDGAPTSVSVLPEIVEVVDKKLKVLLDSGVRTGLDVLKARQLGADACLIGRPWAFALAAGGQQGVDRLLTLMKAELRTAQVLSGISSC
ncbi:L-lactate dehydrogenase [Glaciecola sp. 1036]|uniref:L-lactate dehydrogenase n=1 Tax=Alteromonadaceae TaxID=72275 RepID=UPI003D0501F1